MKIIECAQGSDEWRAARAGVCTASRFSDVMAKIKTGEAADRRNYRTDRVIEQLTGRPLESFTTGAMKQGIEREPQARLAFEEETGLVVREVGFYRHDELRAGASPDGICSDGYGLEIKCPERSAHLRYIQSEGIPPEYRWQVIGQMWICELPAVHFVSWNPDFPEPLQLLVRRVTRDEIAVKSLALEVAMFMAEVEQEAERLRNLKLAA
jgi:putative phage-type endonuclease